MSGLLIRNYPTLATTFNSDDYSDIDGATGGTRKMLLSVMATRFGVQLAADGMVFGAGSAAAPLLAVGTSGNGIYASAANTLDLTTNGTRAITITSGQFVGIGVATPATAFHVGTSLTTSPRGIMSAQYSTGTDGARFHMRKARGTATAPTTVVTGDVLGKLVATGYDGSNYLEMASISLEATGTVAATRVPTKIVFSTATDATPSVLTDRWTITSAGVLQSTGAQSITTSSGNLTIGTGASNGVIYLIPNGTGYVDVNQTIPILRFTCSDTTAYSGFEYRSGSTLEAHVKFRPNTATMEFSAGRSAGWGGEITFLVDTGEVGRWSTAGNLLIGTTSDTGLTGAGGLRVVSTTASTTSATGSAVFGGGVGIGGAAYLGGAVVAAGKITGGSSSLNGNGVVTSYFDSALDDAFAAQNSNATYARTWKFGPNTGTARAFNFRDSTGGTTVLILYDGSASTPYRVSIPASFQVDGDVVISKTITAAGTTGAQTINKLSGSVNFAAAATSLVVTCNLCTVNSVIAATVGTNDTTMKSVAAVAGAGSFTLYANAAPTAETRVNFRITN